MDVMDGLSRKLDKAAKTGRRVTLSDDEVRQAILLLATEDVKQRFLIGNVILQQGLRGVAELVPAMGLEKPEIRRTVIYTLGALAKQLAAEEQPVPSEVMDTLYRCLMDDDPKVRCNSAIALGDLKNSESVGSLVDALARETAPWVRPSLILALGSIGGPEVAEYLSTYEPKDAAERAAVGKVLDRSVTTKIDWHFIKHPAEPIPVELWTVEGLERVAAEGVKNELSLPVNKVTPGCVHTSTTDPYGVFALRAFSELLIPLAKAQVDSPYGASEVRAAIAGKLSKDSILERTLSLHEDQQQIMRYRLEVRGKELKHYIRREIIREIADLIATTSPRFVNSPSNYNIEIRLLLDEGTAELLLKPYTIPDDRFSYRVKDVPAAINPAVAAGVIKTAPRLSASARVLDPFCGSGTMLFERAFAAGYSELVGFDISRAAIHAARKNASVAGLDNVSLFNKDMRKVSRDEPFDEIITNMPFGIRTGKHGANVKLYQDFFDLIPQILVKQGLVILYTQEVSLTTSLFRKSKQLKLLSVQRVASGGLRPAVFVATGKGVKRS